MPPLQPQLPPIPVQIAFQGGGAKLVALLATLEGLCAAERDSKIRIYRLAGTSAGAIAAALYSQGMTLDATTEEKIRRGEETDPRKRRLEQLKEFLAGIRGELSGPRGQKLIRDFRTPLIRGLWRVPKMVISGGPLWSHQALKIWFDQVFQSRTFGMLHLPVTVVTTELGPDPHFESNADTPITEALLDSAGLPFLLRNWTGSGRVFVDGGICENLPLHSLLSDAARFEAGLRLGPNERLVTCGVTFLPELKDAPRSVIGFAKGLLIAAMDNSVQRARRAIGDPRLLHTLNPEIGTFDFMKAFSPAYFGQDKAAVDSAPYRRILAQTSKFVTGLMDRELEFRSVRANRSVNPTYWTETDDRLRTTMERVYETFQRHHGHVRIKLLECRYEIVAMSLLDEKQSSREITYWKFSAADAPIYSTVTFFAADKSKKVLLDTTVEVFDENGKEVEVSCIPFSDGKKPLSRGLLINYLRPLNPSDGSYSERIVDEAPHPLAHFEEFTYGLPERVDVTGAVFEMLLHVPTERKGVHLVSHPDDKGENYGRRMSAERIKAIRRDRDDLRQTYTLGWTSSGNGSRLLMAATAGLPAANDG